MPLPFDRVDLRGAPRWHRCLLLLSWVAACRPTPPPTSPPADPSDGAVAPASGSEDEPATAQAAFVVLTDHSTTVVPVDPAIATRTIPGSWVGGLPGSAAATWGVVEIEVTAELRNGSPTLPICPRGDFGDPCELSLEPSGPDRALTVASGSDSMALQVRVGVDGTLSWTPMDALDHHDCACITVHGISTDGEPTPEFDLDDPDVLADIEMSPYDPEDYEQECGVDALRPEYGTTAILGGRVYLNGMAGTNVCNGLNIYDGARDSWPVRPGAQELKLTFPPAEDCGEEPVADAHDRQDRQDLPDEDDYECDAQWPELVSYRIQHGALVRDVGNIDNVGGECWCSSSVPARGVCPSPLDPCGSPSAITSPEDWDELWVASDDSAALGMDATGLAVLVPAEQAPRRRSWSGDEILGVEFHPHTALLDLPEIPSMFAVALPTPTAADQDFDGSARAWGNRCFAHVKAAQLDAAEAACFRGLLVGGSEGTRGALTYNLGRIEEARDQPDRALAYYERSDQLRPGNATVQARLAALRQP